MTSEQITEACDSTEWQLLLEETDAHGRDIAVIQRLGRTKHDVLREELDGSITGPLERTKFECLQINERVEADRQ